MESINSGFNGLVVADFYQQYLISRVLKGNVKSPHGGSVGKINSILRP